MTNEQIVFQESQRLAAEGLIKYTGRVFTMERDDGETVEIKETESIHTYQIWKQLGFQVQRGQKAVAQIVIWKHTEKQKEDDQLPESRMFMKKASFFSQSQVEAIA